LVQPIIFIIYNGDKSISSLVSWLQWGMGQCLDGRIQLLTVCIFFALLEVPAP
jgi:hypothetical protein